MALIFKKAQVPSGTVEALHHAFKSLDLASGLDETVVSVKDAAGNVQVLTAEEVSVLYPPQPQAELEELTEEQALTSEYLKLYETLEEAGGKPLLFRMEEIRKSLQSIANDTMDPNQPAVMKCSDGEIEFTTRAVVTEFPVVGPLLHLLIEKFGEDVAFSVVKISITELRKVLSENEITNVSIQKPGSRTLKYVRPAKK